jgi:hypothetical protein
LTILALLIVAVSAIYATAGQAGGTGFLAVLALTEFPGDEMRMTALALNVVAAGYATWRLQYAKVVDWALLRLLAVASLPAAFIGGLIVLQGRVYSGLTGCLLLAAAILMIFRRLPGSGKSTILNRGSALLVGASTGVVSGLTGLGGGVFLVPLLILRGWASPNQAARLSPPFILTNSAAALAAALLAGQRVASANIGLLAGAALAGSAIGTAIGLRWMSEAMTRYVIAAVLLTAAAQLLFRSIV